MNDILMERYVAVERLVSRAESSDTNAGISSLTDALMPLLTALFMDAQGGRHRKVEKLTRRLIERTIRLLRPLAEAEARQGDRL